MPSTKYPHPSEDEKLQAYDDHAQSDEYKRLSPLRDEDLIPDEFLRDLYKAICTDQYSQTDIIRPIPGRDRHQYKITGTLTADKIYEMWSEDLAEGVGLTEIERQRCRSAIRASNGNARHNYKGDITELLSEYMSADYFNEREFNECVGKRRTPPAELNNTPLDNEEVKNRLKHIGKAITSIVRDRLRGEIRAINEDRKFKRQQGMREATTRLYSQLPKRQPSL